MAEDCDGGGALSESTYLATREGYDRAELEVSGRYDKWILTLAGGALGLSVVFLEKIVPHPLQNTLAWLVAAWICFGGALLAGLTSFLTSQHAIRENRRELDRAHGGGRALSLSFPRWFSWLTDGLNWVALLAFILGVFSLCTFSVTNISTVTKKGVVVHEQRAELRGSSH